MNAEQASKKTDVQADPTGISGKADTAGCKSEDYAQLLHRVVAAACTQGKRRQHGKPEGEVKTKSSPSYVEDGYVEDGYQKRLLEVEVEEGRWIEAEIVVEDVVMFWRDFFKQYRPQEKLPQPRNPFTVMPGWIAASPPWFQHGEGLLRS